MAGNRDMSTHYEAMSTNPEYCKYEYLLAFSYIGVSKLPCKPCVVWPVACGKLGFYTRGTHSPLYRVIPPPLEDVQSLCRIF
jgi:hypothetical protein